MPETAAKAKYRLTSGATTEATASHSSFATASGETPVDPQIVLEGNLPLSILSRVPDTVGTRT